MRNIAGSKIMKTSILFDKPYVKFALMAYAPDVVVFQVIIRLSNFILMVK